eukprot:TRINITY_DN12573_c2_g3_i6.p1 TRINITY_DN12573_c2_g3~~TRINITY_DN12573_c2_g3_i6.p1  ORF type:complete len:572 (+),score=92.56 TRINITY_DN12573_c2_g3_i6:3053-4768(+)
MAQSKMSKTDLRNAEAFDSKLLTQMSDLIKKGKEELNTPGCNLGSLVEGARHTYKLVRFLMKEYADRLTTVSAARPNCAIIYRFVRSAFETVFPAETQVSKVAGDIESEWIPYPSGEIGSPNQAVTTLTCAANWIFVEVLAKIFDTMLISRDQGLSKQWEFLTDTGRRNARLRSHVRNCRSKKLPQLFKFIADDFRTDTFIIIAMFAFTPSTLREKSSSFATKYVRGLHGVFGDTFRNNDFTKIIARVLPTDEHDNFIDSYVAFCTQEYTYEKDEPQRPSDIALRFIKTQPNSANFDLKCDDGVHRQAYFKQWQDALCKHSGSTKYTGLLINGREDPITEHLLACDICEPVNSWYQDGYRLRHENGTVDASATAAQADSVGIVQHADGSLSTARGREANQQEQRSRGGYRGRGRGAPRGRGNSNYNNNAYTNRGGGRGYGRGRGRGRGRGNSRGRGSNRGRGNSNNYHANNDESQYQEYSRRDNDIRHSDYDSSSRRERVDNDTQAELVRTQHELAIANARLEGMRAGLEAASRGRISVMDRMEPRVSAIHPSRLAAIDDASASSTNSQGK